MAHVDVDTALGGLHGKIDGFVFRKQGEKTLCYRLPKDRRPPSEAQKKTMRTFGDASHWVRTVVKPDPVLRALYKKRGRERRKRPRNFRQMAIRDFFHAPKVEALDTEHYCPAEGGRLLVRATDDFEVVRVHVVLRDDDGAVVTEGDATSDFTAWRFDVAPIPVGGKPPVLVEATAFDRPGNATTRRFPLRRSSGLNPGSADGAAPAISDAPATKSVPSSPSDEVMCG